MYVCTHFIIKYVKTKKICMFIRDINLLKKKINWKRAKSLSANLQR